MMKQKIIVISGPTAVGKTKLALKIAKLFNLDLINADASQMRTNMDIGTANVNDLELVGIKHHLFKFLEPDANFSIKDYQDLGRNILSNLDKAIVVGGSGLYIDSLLLDYDLTSSARNEEFNINKTNHELYEELLKLDPVAAAKTHENNRKRILRYLEIINSGAILEKKEAKELYDILYITLDLDRLALYKRIDERFDLMINDGWCNEVKELKTKGYDLSKIKEIGYSDLNDYLNGNISYEEAKENVLLKTHHYAKRQLTWFRGSKNKYHNYHVFSSPKDDDAIINIIKDFIKD